jgi:hypothetical protein
MVINSPCKDCTKRNVSEHYNCHHDCPEYIAYRAELERLNNEQKDDVYASYVINAVYRKRKMKNEKNRT